MRPTASCVASVTHSAPSGPDVMEDPITIGIRWAVTTPAVVIRAITYELLPMFVNHNAPSGPVVIATDDEMLTLVNLVTTPVVVIRPIELLPLLVNQRAPSGPDVMSTGDEMVASVK